jgi:hypothetical protein
MSYRTFLRSARNFEEFSSAEKREVEAGLSYDEARDACKEFNNNRSDDDIDSGTKMEFEEE